MKNKIIRTFLALSFSLHFTSNINAAAFQLYELGTPIMGTAAVGQAAAITDASTAYFNPAAMTLLPTSEFMLGGQLIVPQIHFQANSANTIAGNNGGGAGLLATGIGTFYVRKFSPNLYLGASFSLPAVGVLDYNDGWVGRYAVQNVSFLAMGFNPVIAYKVNDNFSIGGGVTIYYSQLDETIAIPFPPPLADGQIEADSLNDVATQFNMGFLITLPKSQTRIGVAYRSKVTFNLQGTTRFLRLPVTPTISSQIILPHNVIVSLYQPITNKFAIVADGGWAKWSDMQSTPIQIGGLVSVAIPRNWKNTWRAGIGGQYYLTHALMVQSGVSFDSSPTNAMFRLPDLPMDKQLRIATGLVLHVNDKISLASSYEYADFGKAAINDVRAFPGTLAGNYSVNRNHFIQISINGKV
jgi:long-chain fatty acid transport protein